MILVAEPAQLYSQKVRARGGVLAHWDYFYGEMQADKMVGENSGWVLMCLWVVRGEIPVEEIIE